MSRLLLVTACKTALLSEKPDLQPLRAALTGLQQLCTWAADGTKVDSQTPAVEAPSRRKSRQLLTESAATNPAVKHGTMPNWPGSQQHGHSEGRLHNLRGFYTSIEDCTKDHKFVQVTPNHVRSDIGAPLLPAGLQETSRQAAQAVGSKSAKRITYDIKQQWQLAAQSVWHSSPEKVMEAYYGCMDEICRQEQLNYIHINAIVYGTVRVWTALEASHHGWITEQQADQNLHNFIVRMLKQLQPLLPAVRTREAANLLWSVAKLGLNPDALVPGMTDRLAHQFMLGMDAAVELDFANVLVACAKLQLSPSQGKLVRAILNRLATADLSNFQPQSVANTLHSLVTLPAVAPSVKVLDALCHHFGVLLKSRQAAELPNAQSIANTMWALSKLKHAPPDELAMSMVGRMVALCRVPGQQPTPQNISNVLLACAQLSLPVKQADSGILADLVLKLDRRQGSKQEYANTAWSLAVMGHLHQDQLALLLELLTALAVGRGEMSDVSELNIAELRQLYQALEWLKPPVSAPALQHQAWSSLQGKLHKLGPRPEPTERYLWGNDKLCSALQQLQLPFWAIVSIQSYWADAVLTSPGNKAQPIIMTLCNPDYIKNIPGRLTGRAMFRYQLLAKEGRLVDVPQEMASDAITVEQLANYLEPILTAAAEGFLDAYRN
ncbi:hypothetical protein WJX77_011700 [Trebouxia sp. C0004]